MLLGLLPIFCFILVTGMADGNKRRTISYYFDSCPTLNNIQSANLTTKMLAGTWFENCNTGNTGYKCAYYTHQPNGTNNITSTFAGDFQTDSTGTTYAPQKFQLLWELITSLNQRAHGAGCFVTQGDIIQGPYWFIEVIPGKLYVAFSCDKDGKQTLHIVTQEKDINKEDYRQEILARGIPETLFNQLQDSYTTKDCS